LSFNETTDSQHPESFIQCNWPEFLNNQLLIMTQDPQATQVAGYTVWSRLGRQVRKGEHGIAILAPVVRRVTDENGGEELRQLHGFRVVHVFDILQTEGEALPKVTMPPVRVPDERLREQIVLAASAAGLKVVTVAADPAGTRGWYEPATRTISLVTSHPAASQVRTLLHELAHACDPVVGTPQAVRAERELVAESAAYLVGTDFGIDLDEASTVYVTSWGADRQVLLRLAGEVLAVAPQVDAILGELSLPDL
jgi:antirestriction protein ArdC